MEAAGAKDPFFLILRLAPPLAPFSHGRKGGESESTNASALRDD